MTELKDSGIEWLGDIPEHWKISNVGKHFEIILGKMLQPNKINESDTLENYLCAVNLGKNQLNLNEIRQMWFSESEKKIYSLKKNDLLVVEGGDIASSAILNFEVEDLYFQNALHRVRAKETFSIIFLKYWLSFVKSTGYIDLICNKATIAHFTKKKFCKLPFVLPPIEEQKEIAAFLDKKCSAIDSAVDAAKKLVEKLREYKKSLITETVTKGLNPSAEMKDSGIEWLGDIPEHWKICRLKNLADIKNGQEYKNFFDENGKYPVIGSGGEFARSTNFLYDKPSVLLGRKGTIDKPLFVDFPFWTVDTMYYTEIKNTVDSKFFYYLCLQIPFDYYQYGSALPSMTQRDLNSVKFPLPPIEEQKEIVSFLDKKCSAIDENIFKHQRLTEKLSEYKKSLIYEVVTGKMEV